MRTALRHIILAIREWLPSELFRHSEVGVWYDPSDSTTVFTDSAGTIPAVLEDPVGKILDKSGNGKHATQATAAARGTLKATGVVEWIDYDGVDDVHNTTFPVSLGTACTVARANVGGAPTILTAQTIGTSYASSTDHAGLIIVNRALTASETASLTAYLTAKGAS